MALVLETLRGDKTLDAGGLCIGLFAFGFGLNFTADDEFADLVVRTNDQQQLYRRLRQQHPRLPRCTWSDFVS